MTRLSALVKCPPKKQVNPNWSDNGSRQTFMQNWPKAQYEPYGNPAYEGYGYPAAGYGQQRRKVVGLDKPKVADPQLFGWEGKQPQLNVVTVGALNPKSDAYTREVVGTLAGLGCACSPTDQRMVKQLNGFLGQAAGSWTAESIGRAIVANTVPSSFLDALTDKLVEDERLNAKAYAAVQALKAIGSPSAADLQRRQEASWGQTNTAKFYALLIPQMRDRLGFTSGSPKVTPPVYSYIKAGANAGVFAKVAGYLREAALGNAAKDLLDRGYMKESLGLAPAVIIVPAIAIAVAAAALAYMKSADAPNVYAATVADLTKQRTSGRISQREFEQTLARIQQTKPEGGGTSPEDMVKWAAIGVGGIVLLSVLANLRTLLPAR